MPASSILLFETDPVADAGVEAILSGTGYSVTRATTADETIRLAPDHQVVILDVTSGVRSGIDICAEIRATPSLSAVPVMCISASDDVEERIRFLEAGADDVMAHPLDVRELEARVEALLLRFKRSRDPSAISSDGVVISRAHRLVVVFSPKGGAGTTTIATNIAVAAAARRPNQVVLVDLALQFGGVATHLNLRPKRTLADIIRDEAALREAELLRTYATTHSSGLHVLAAPAQPEAAETITPSHVDRILGTLFDAYELIVVDAGSTLDERVLAVFERADTVVLPVYPEIAALNAMHALLEYLIETGALGLEGDVRAQQHVRSRDPQAARRRECARVEGRPGAPVRPIHLPQGSERGHPRRDRGDAIDRGRTPRPIERHGIRARPHRRSAAGRGAPVGRPVPQTPLGVGVGRSGRCGAGAGI